MKAIISSTILFLFSFSGHGQLDTSIVGVWKILSIYKDGIYYNLKTDSISLSKENKLHYVDKSQQQKLIAGLKTVYLLTRYHFGRGGIFKLTVDGELMFDGSYRNMPQQKTIEMITKNSLNEAVAEKVKYIFKNGLLCMSMEWDDEMVDLVLEREK